MKVKNLRKLIENFEENKYKKLYSIGDKIKMEAEIIGVLEKKDWWSNKIMYQYMINFMGNEILIK